LATLVDAGLAGLTAFAVFQLLVLGLYLGAVTRGVWNLASLSVIHRPIALSLLTGVAVAFRVGAGRPGGWAWTIASLVACAAALGIQAWGRVGDGGALESLLPVAPFLAASFAASLLLTRSGARRWRLKRGGTLRWTSTPLLVALSLLGGSLYSTLRPHAEHPAVNRVGLVTSPPGSKSVQDLTGVSFKDNYPPCTFEYNSLGYRDVEPANPGDPRRRILLVGDSFIWGDGIPTNGETLAYQLREELERQAPGRFSVMTAAYPGLGPYGYRRILGALVPVYRPEVILVHYVPGGHLLSDPQFLIDRLPAPGLARHAVQSLNGLRFLNEVISLATSTDQPEWTELAERAVDLPRVLQAMTPEADGGGARVVFFLYSRYVSKRIAPDRLLPASIERAFLPAEWEYPGHPTELWYAKDFHPKPKLNHLVAAHLADLIISGPAPR